MTLYLLKVHLQTLISIPITQKCQILSCDTRVANEQHDEGGNSRFLQNFDKFIPDNRVSHFTEDKNILQFLTHTNTYLANCSSAILRAFDNGTFLSSFTDIIPSKYLGMVMTVELALTGEMSTITNFSTSSG